MVWKTEEMALIFWGAVEKDGGSSGRTEVLLNIDKLDMIDHCGHPLYPSVPYNNSYGFNTAEGTAAYRWNNWKLLTGNPGTFFQVPLTDPLPGHNDFEGLCAEDPDFDYNHDGPQESVYLYDLDNDPEERYNLQKDYPEIVDTILGKIAHYEPQSIPWAPITQDRNSPVNGVLQPWG